MCIKNVPYLYKKYRMCMKKSWHQKNMFEKNVNHVFEKMFLIYTKNIECVWKKVDTKKICLKKMLIMYLKKCSLSIQKI